MRLVLFIVALVFFAMSLMNLLMVGTGQIENDKVQGLSNLTMIYSKGFIESKLVQNNKVELAKKEIDTPL